MVICIDLRRWTGYFNSQIKYSTSQQSCYRGRTEYSLCLWVKSNITLYAVYNKFFLSKNKNNFADRNVVALNNI